MKTKRPPVARPARELNVLFIGNSFTARNDLPGLVARLAAAAGSRLDHQLVSVGGASLRTHWNKGDALRVLRAGKFDAVVLQEQSTLPVKNAARMHDNVRLFDGAIRAAGARTVLYETWARRHAPDTQAAITDAYATIGAELKAAIIPAGSAWRAFLRDHDRPVLHDRDGSHPTLAGSYLAACVAFGVLFRGTPADPTVEPEGLSDADAAMLRAAAGLAVASVAAATGPGRRRV